MPTRTENPESAVAIGASLKSHTSIEDERIEFGHHEKFLNISLGP
jgi:hypothetical protein